MAMISGGLNGGCEAVVEALQAEFGAILAARIFEAEAADFLWDARVKERYLGQHISLEDDAEERSQIAILGFLAGRWHVAMCLIDGEGSPVDLLWKQSFGRRDEAQAAFDRAA
jgi:hypothetical protein